jgi:hypothetical protein
LTAQRNDLQECQSDSYSSRQENDKTGVDDGVLVNSGFLMFRWELLPRSTGFGFTFISKFMAMHVIPFG